MSKLARVEGLGTLRFPDDTPDEVIDRTVHREIAQRDLNQERGWETPPQAQTGLWRPTETTHPMAEGVVRAVDTASAALGRVSLGGLGRISKAVADDVMTGGLPGVPGLGLLDGKWNGMRATRAELSGEPEPEDIQQNIQGSVIKSGLSGLAESAPTIAAGMALGGPAGMALAMGASEAERSDLDPYKTLKAAAMGAALPFIGAAGRGLAGLATGRAVQAGATALANPAVQKSIEFGGSQLAVQGTMLADLMNSEEYKSAPPEEQKRMLQVATVQNLAFAGPEAWHATRPGVVPVASRYEGQAVKLARTMESEQPLGLVKREISAGLEEAGLVKKVIGTKEFKEASDKDQNKMVVAAALEDANQKSMQQGQPAEVTDRLQAQSNPEQISKQILPIATFESEAVAPGIAGDLPAQAMADAQRRIVTPAEGTGMEGGDALAKLKAWYNPEEVKQDVAEANPTEPAPFVQGERIEGRPLDRAEAGREEWKSEFDKKQTPIVKEGTFLESNPEDHPVMVPGEATEGRTPIPEDPKALAEQIRLTADPKSTKAATLITHGEEMPAEVPKGLAVAETPHGKVIFNPEKTTPEAVAKAGAGKLFDGTLLGQGGDGSKPVAGRKVVTTHTDKAKNVVTEIVPDNDPTATAKAVAAQKAAVPGGKTEVKPAIEVAQERLAAAEKPKSKLVDINDDDAIEKWLKSKIDPEQDERGVHSGVPPNMLIRAALSFYRAGKTAADAIDTAIEFGKRSGPIDEPAMRAMLTAAMPPAPPRAPVGARPAPPVGRPLKTLADAEKHFEPIEKEKRSAGEIGRAAIERFREGMYSVYRPIAEMQEKVNKFYGNPKAKQDLAADFELLKGSSGKAELDVTRFDEAMKPHLKGIERKDFNSYMLAKRVVDRLIADPEVKRVEDWSIDDAENVLNQLKAKVTPEQWQKLEDAGTMFNIHMDQALQRQVDSSRMSQQQYNDIKNSNTFYAPFAVMKHFIDSEVKIPKGAGRKVDTQETIAKAIKGIYDKDFRLGDMMAAGRRQIAMSRILAEKNLRMLSIADLAKTDTQNKFIRKLGPDEKPVDGKETVVAMEYGKPVHYEVDPRVAEAVQAAGRVTADVGSKVLAAMATPFRAGATGLNLMFQGVNLGWDQWRLAAMSKLGVRNPMDLYRYPVDVIHGVFAAISSNKIIPGVEPMKLARDFLESGAAGSTIQNAITPEALTYREPSRLETGLSITKTILTTPAHIANAIEEATKMAGIKRALRISGAKSGEQLARQFPELVTEVRRFAGSPDFGRSGKWTQTARLNLLFMFYNARLQGLSADVGRLAGMDGKGIAAAAATRAAFTIVAPAMIAWLYNNSPEYKADYEKLSQNERDNYFPIPKDKFIINDQGEKVRDWWRIPKKDIAKSIANLTEAALAWYASKDPKGFAKFAMTALEDLAPVNVSGRSLQERAESVVSSTNPLIKGLVEFGTGRNTYTHQDLIRSDLMKKGSPEKAFTDRTQEAFKKLAVWMPKMAPEVLRNPIMLENLTQNLTAGLIMQFMPTKGIEGREGIENWRFLRRFQTQGYVDNPEYRERLEAFQRKGADVALDRERTAEKIVKDAGDDSSAAMKAAFQAFRTTQDKAGIERVLELVRAKRSGITPEEKRLLTLSPPQRAQFFAEEIAKLPQDKAMAYLADMARKRVLSKQTQVELMKLRMLLQSHPGTGSR